MWRKTHRWTQDETANKVGISRSYYANLESGAQSVPKPILDSLIGLGFKPEEVGPPLVPAPQMLVPVPYIGGVAASSEVSWGDPYEAIEMKMVPPEMAEGRGRFCCHIIGDSMYPLLHPGDLCVFRSTNLEKLGHVVIFRTPDSRVTIKTLKHDGRSFFLHPENPNYEDIRVEGQVIGFLIGVVREAGSQRITITDLNGIRP